MHKRNTANFTFKIKAWIHAKKYTKLQRAFASHFFDLLGKIMMRNEQSGIEKLIPGVWNTGKAPVAAVLDHSRASWDLHWPVDWRMSILPVVCHLCNVQIEHWCFHFSYYWFEDFHHPWMVSLVVFISYGLCLSITAPTSVPLPFPVKCNAIINRSSE